MAEVPIYFEYCLNDDNTDEYRHGNFIKIFDKLKYFKEYKNINILHIGAYTGHGTRWMLERLPQATCIDVDTWKGSLLEDGHLDFHETFYDDRVEQIYDEQTKDLKTIKFKGASSDFFAQNNQTFDFIYIDGSHKMKDVWNDLTESFKILNPSGIIGCDDYLWKLDEDPKNIPYYAINTFIKQNAKKIKVLIDNYQLWFQKI